MDDYKLNVGWIDDMDEALRQYAQSIRPSMELFWFAIDKHNRLGAFCSAGSAYVPDYVVTHREDFLSCFNEIAVERPYTASPQWVASEDDLESIEFASKGFCCFDARSEITAIYQKTAHPDAFITLDDISASSAKYLKSLRFSYADFLADSAVDISIGRAVIR